MIRLLFPILFLCLMASCTTVKTVEVERVVNDTLVVVKSDTVRNTKFVTQKEFVYTSDTVIIVQDDSGNVKSKEHIRNKIVEKESHDSTSFYRSKADSLRSVIDKMSNEKEVIYKSEKDYRGFALFIMLLTAVMARLLCKKIFKP